MRVIKVKEQCQIRSACFRTGITEAIPMLFIWFTGAVGC